jgi:hypothetical protein
LKSNDFFDAEIRCKLARVSVARLKCDIDQGLADVAALRVTQLDPKTIIARGKELLAKRTTLRLTGAAQADLASRGKCARVCRHS